MCELFGVNSARPVICNDLLADFFTHSCDHPQGWGIATLFAEGTSLEKEPLEASKSAYLSERLNATIETRNLFAHIRLATVGNMEYNNCHPFVYRDMYGRPWTQNHNGTLFDAPDVDPYFYKQRGSTDSERLLLYTIDQVNSYAKEAGRELTPEERIDIIEGILERESPHNKVNYLLFDGEQMYVHSNYKNSLHVWQDGDTAWFSTQPLKYGEWEPVPFCRLSVYKNGRHIYTGASHGNEYIDNPEDLKYLMNFAEL